MHRFECSAVAAICAVSAALFCAGCSTDSGSNAVVDATPPTVTGSHPLNGAADIAPSGPYWIAFSETMDGSSVLAAFSLTPGPVYFDTQWRGDTLVVTPTVLLDGGTSYSMTVGAEAEDAHGNALGAAYAVGFTTTTAADNTPPTVLSTSPANGAVDVSGIEPIEIVWSEPMNRLETQNAIAVAPEPADWWVEWESLTMKLHHSAFPQEQLVTVTVGTGARDLSGNALASPYAMSFTTASDNTRPHLASASPSNGAAGVSTSLSQIVLTFSEPMDPLSFRMAADHIDARIIQAVREEPSWNADRSSITVHVGRALLPGCTYWVRFWNVTDGSGNVIDPNPTNYEFTTTGMQTFYPVKTGASWSLLSSRDATATRVIESYSTSTGNFDEVRLDEVGRTAEIVHLRKASSEIYHRGRSEYEDGAYEFSMMWDDPILYLRFPLENYLGQSWSFSTTATISQTVSMSLSGRCEIGAAKVNLENGVLEGTFRGCYVHHLFADYIIYENGIPIDEGSVHQILWLAPGVGPVQFVSEDGGGADTLRVYDWNL